MTKREWKYLGRKWRQRHGWGGFTFMSYKIKKYDSTLIDFNKVYDDPFSNFAIMIPTQPFKSMPRTERQPTRSQVRYNINWKGISTVKGGNPQKLQEVNGIEIYSSRKNIKF